MAVNVPVWAGGCLTHTQTAKVIASIWASADHIVRGNELDSCPNKSGLPLLCNCTGLVTQAHFGQT